MLSGALFMVCCLVTVTFTEPLFHLFDVVRCLISKPWVHGLLSCYCNFFPDPLVRDLMLFCVLYQSLEFMVYCLTTVTYTWAPCPWFDVVRCLVSKPCVRMFCCLVTVPLTEPLFRLFDVVYWLLSKLVFMVCFLAKLHHNLAFLRLAAFYPSLSVVLCLCLLFSCL
jgi:hypothetical protein